jgi:putative SOS response-associated peptidase YedK
MCGRFTLTYEEKERVARELGVDPDMLTEEDYKARYNIAPTDRHWIVRQRREDREIVPAKWGLVNTWAKDAKRAAAQINARAETLKKLPAFRDAFEKRRCVVPADGFYEWTGTKETRRPIWFHRPEGGLLLFAGLYESWYPAPEQRERTFTIVTTAANDLITPIHDRMPAILVDDEAIDAWLFGEADTDGLLELLKPAPEGVLVGRPVSQRANSVKNDDPECLVEYAPLL